MPFGRHVVFLLSAAHHCAALLFSSGIRKMSL
nr:MAG TPA: hypothetical protein [Caudoviricetes sp.]